MHYHEQSERITSESFIHRSRASDSSLLSNNNNVLKSSVNNGEMLRNNSSSLPRNQTVFPVSTVDSTKSSLLSETLGAYGEVHLSNPNSPQRHENPQQTKSAYLNQDGSLTLQLAPLQQNRLEERPTSFNSNPSFIRGNSPYNQLLQTPPSYTEMARQEKVYMPTTEPILEMQPRHYDKFAEVYSNSGDTVEFAQNVGSYVSDRIPPMAWFGLMSATCLIGFLILLMGAFNIPFCNVQPMIPIWLLVLGVLIIISSCVRIYAAIPMPSNRRRQAQAQTRATRLSSDLCIKGTELILFLTIIIWMILGCVWVYGSKWYVHFDESMFEEHYCDPSLYWIAFCVCTGGLVCIALIVIAILIMMMGGAMKSN
ncbi:unnamed protein product, partial [Mesorhabditis belari]|uniref:Uncharacterized protein n=1 Tax=Mesorhabditis belari TaxID=2138241 RepID=A0AAF3F7F3_9BILA